MGQFQSAMFPHDAAQQQQTQDEVPWFLRYGARGMGAVGGLLAIVLGLWTCISITPICIVAGIFQILAGFLLVIFEAPCCCPFLDHVQQMSKFGDSKPHWQKAAFYLVLSLPPIVLCQSLGAIFGSGLIFITAMLYGMMALGKKAPRDEMLRRASATSKTELKSAEYPMSVTSEPVPP